MDRGVAVTVPWQPTLLEYPHNITAMASILRTSLAQGRSLQATASSSRTTLDWTASRHYASSTSSSSKGPGQSSARPTPPPPAPRPTPPPAQQRPPQATSTPSPPQKKPLSQSSVASEQDKLPLPWLSRPLGIPSKPLSAAAAAALPKRSSKDRAQDYLSGGRQKERENIVKSATKGYFHDFHSLKAHGGKTWRAPATMIREDRALWFPQVSGTCLADRTTKDTVEMTAGKVSVIAILNSRISEVSLKAKCRYEGSCRF